MKTRLLPFALLFFCTVALAAAPLTLVRAGRSEYQIVIAPDALPAVRAAAAELRDYLQKSTGAELPIVNRAAPGKPAIFIGALKVTEPEGFIIRTEGKNLHISGYDTPGNPYSTHWKSSPMTGTWHGVVDFLEKQLGIRWFFPGPEGEYVPRHPTLTLPELNVKDAPVMNYRSMGHLFFAAETPPGQIREIELWLRRNRNGHSVVWSGSHSWIENFRGEDFYKAHPDWFALVDGRRLSSSPYGLQMCTTNPDALDKFAEIIIEKSRANGGIMFSLSPNDGTNHCECAKCRALDNGVRPNGSRIMTDRYITYCNEIAKRVTKVLPDQKFGFYAYSFYSEPPSPGLAIHPNVCIMNVHNESGALYHIQANRQDHLENELIPWSRKVANLYFYGTPEGFGSLDLPAHNAKGIKLLFDNLDRAGIKGFSMNQTSSFGATGLNNYLYLKKCWNPKADTEQLYNDALRDCYGSGAKIVGDYFAEVENRFYRFANSGATFDRSLGVIRRFPDTFETVYRNLAPQWLPKLRAAMNQCSDAGQKARIAMLVRNLEYCEAITDCQQLAAGIVGRTDVSSAEVAKALKLLELMEKRRDVLTRLPDNTSLRRIAWIINATRLPLRKEIFQYLLSSNENKIARARHTAAAPTLDGQIEPEYWSALAALPVRSDRSTGRELATATTAKVAINDGNLYIAFHCPEPAMDQLHDSHKKPGSPVWQDNCIELFFDPEVSGTKFRQLLVNSLGTVTSPGWDSEAEVQTFHGKDFWSAEIRIPLKSIAAAASYRGKIWGFNLTRSRRTVLPAEYGCWSPTFGNFAKPERFGRLVLY